MPCRIAGLYAQSRKSVVDFSCANMLATNETIEKLFEADTLEVSYEASTHILYCRWKGFQDRESIVSGGTAILQIVKQKGIQRILNDNSTVTGSWWEPAAWIAEVWFPQMIDAGLKQFAWVLSQNIFSELSARRAMEPHSPIVMAFYTCQEAYHWISPPNHK